VIANAVLSIVSSVIGGGLVLAGQFFVKRAEDKRVWLIRLQEAASDLATSYLQEAATVNDRRRAGTEMSRVETATYVVDRQKALGRFRTLPWSSDFEAQRRASGEISRAGGRSCLLLADLPARGYRRGAMRRPLAVGRPPRGSFICVRCRGRRVYGVAAAPAGRGGCYW
jgi:hypothetical protein